MDIRDQQVAEKHYALIPIPVLEMLAKAGLNGPQMAIYMLHWSSGHIRGDWKSCFAVSVIMKRFKISRATVQRAYKGLVKKGLIRREQLEPGTYGIPTVEVILPEESRQELMDTPNRLKTGSERLGIEGRAVKIKEPEQAQESTRHKHVKGEPSNNQGDSKRTGGGEEGVPAWVNHATHLLVQNSVWLSDFFREHQGSDNDEDIRPRKITPGMAYKLRKAIESTSPPELAFSRWQQALWSMEEGQLLGRPVRYAFNMVMWLLKRNIWRRPYGMPRDWTWSYGPSMHRDVEAMVV